MKRIMNFILSALTIGVVAPVAAEPAITVELVLLETPSAVSRTTDPGSTAPHPSRLVVGKNVFLEAWCRAGSSGITSAILDIAYPTEFFDTSIESVTRDPQWNTLSYEHFVDEAEGIVDNVGGNNLANWRKGEKWLGISPEWAKIATIEFEVIKTPAGPISFCSFSARHYSLAKNARTARFITFAIKGKGLERDVEFGCVTIGCNSDAECDDNNLCTDEVCREGVCVSTNNSAPCNDNLFCTVTDVCSNGKCVGTGSPCGSGEVCDEDADLCKGSKRICTAVSSDRFSIGPDLFLTLSVDVCYEADPQ